MVRKPGDSEEFVQTAADRIGGAEGNYIYFHVALGLNCRDRVKQGFSALEQLYGSTNYQRNALAFLAVRQGDSEFAQ